MDTCPDWTCDDPRAPWNEPDYNTIARLDAEKVIDEEIARGDEVFLEWLIDEALIDQSYFDASEEEKETILFGIRNNPTIIRDYIDYRWNDVIQYCADLHCDDGPDYDEYRDE